MVEVFKNYTVNRMGVVFKNSTDKIMTHQKCKNGYHRVWLTVNGKRKTYMVHRLVAFKYVDGDKTLEINHKDGDKSNNWFKNLEWVSHSENLYHASNNGLLKSKKGMKYKKRK